MCVFGTCGYTIVQFFCYTGATHKKTATQWLHSYTRKSGRFMHLTRCNPRKSGQIADLLLIRMSVEQMGCRIKSEHPATASYTLYAESCPQSYAIEYILTIVFGGNINPSSAQIKGCYIRISITQTKMQRINFTIGIYGFIGSIAFIA